jgi:iron complex outermembrane receptor protein
MAQNRINSEYGESKTPAFTVFNVKSGYSVPFAKTVVDIGLGITNLLNKAYYEHLDWGRINRPGRSVDLFIRFSY